MQTFWEAHLCEHGAVKTLTQMLVARFLRVPTRTSRQVHPQNIRRNSSTNRYGLLPFLSSIGVQMQTGFRTAALSLLSGNAPRAGEVCGRRTWSPSHYSVSSHSGTLRVVPSHLVFQGRAAITYSRLSCPKGARPQKFGILAVKSLFLHFLPASQEDKSCSA